MTYLADWMPLLVRAPISYVDTIEVQVPLYQCAGIASALRKLARKRLTMRDATRKLDGKPREKYGIIFELKQPRISELRILESRSSHKVIRCDVALDFLFKDIRVAKALRMFFIRHLGLKWNGGRTVRTHKNTHYAASADSTRNYGLYVDKPSRTHGGPCCHLEIRIISARSCARAGVSQLSDIIHGLDVARLFDHQTHILHFDPKKLTRRANRLAENFLRNRKAPKGRFLSRIYPRNVDHLSARTVGLMLALIQTRRSRITLATVQQVPVRGLKRRFPALAERVITQERWKDALPDVEWFHFPEENAGG